MIRRILSVVLLLSCSFSSCSVWKNSSIHSPIAPYQSKEPISAQQVQEVGNIIRFHLLTRKFESDTVIDTKATFISAMEHQIQEKYSDTDIKQVLPFISSPGTYHFYAPVSKVFQNSKERPPLLEETDTIEYVFEVLSLETPDEYRVREETDQAELYLIQKQNIYQYFLEKKLDTSLIEEKSKGIFIYDRNIKTTLFQKEQAAISHQDSIAVHYNGFLLNGSMFDSSYQRDEPFQFRLNSGQVIPAWDLGISGLELGKRYYLACTSNHAYGKYGTGGQIGPNEVLIFQIEVIERY